MEKRKLFKSIGLGFLVFISAVVSIPITLGVLFSWYHYRRAKKTKNKEKF